MSGTDSGSGGNARTALAVLAIAASIFFGNVAAAETVVDAKQYDSECRLTAKFGNWIIITDGTWIEVQTIDFPLREVSIDGSIQKFRWSVGGDLYGKAAEEVWAFWFAFDDASDTDRFVSPAERDKLLGGIDGVEAFVDGNLKARDALYISRDSTDLLSLPRLSALGKLGHSVSINILFKGTVAPIKLSTMDLQGLLKVAEQMRSERAAAGSNCRR
jgi:hypothetical protein